MIMTTYEYTRSLLSSPEAGGKWQMEGVALVDKDVAHFTFYPVAPRKSVSQRLGRLNRANPAPAIFLRGGNLIQLARPSEGPCFTRP